MKKTVLILSLLALLLGGWVAALWLLPSAVYKGDCQEIRYGVNEGLELVEQDNGAKGKRYVVEDADGNELFTIPLRGCLLDTRFRNGQLRFREQNSKREGFIDRQGMVVFTEDNKNAVPEANRQQAQMLMNGETEEGTKSAADYQPEEQASECTKSRKDQPSFAGKSQDDGTVESFLQGSLENHAGQTHRDRCQTPPYHPQLLRTFPQSLYHQGSRFPETGI